MAGNEGHEAGCFTEYRNIMTLQTDDWQQRDGIPLRLAVTPRPGEEAPLGRFRFGTMEALPGDLETDHAWLGGDLGAEYWQADGPVSRGEEDGLYWSATDDLLLMSMALDNSGDDDPADVSHDSYRRLVEFARAAGHPWLLRLWNFLPQINRGYGDHERYRRFCLGRNLALEEAGVTKSELCAATAVGTHGRRLLIHVLAGRAPGMPVENPRQVAAYHYPRIYGPRSPSFARGMVLGLDGGDHGLFVSGTASIVGHRTIHPDQLMPQLDETIMNLESLLSEAASRLARPALQAFNRNSLLRVYLRDRSRWDAVEQRLRATWPEAWIVGLEAEICRRELMVEIEAFHRG